MKGCGVCGKVLARSRSKYCSYACSYQGQREVVKFTCRYCGREFTLRPSEYKKLSIADICSVRCALAWSEPVVKHMRAEGQPLVEVTETSVECLVCGKRLTAIGTHMQNHGVETGGLNHLERNLVLGLKVGERAIAGVLVEAQRDRASLDSFGDRMGILNGPGANTDWEKRSMLWRASTPSDKQRANLVLQAKLLHERACKRGPRPKVSVATGVHAMYARLRAVAVRYLEDGMSEREVARQLGLDRKTVRTVQAEMRWPRKVI